MAPGHRRPSGWTEPVDLSGRTATLLLALVLLVSAGCFIRVVGFDFLNWDDPRQVTENPLVLAKPSPANTVAIFGTTVTSHYQPLVTLTMNLVSWASGTDSGAFHAVSLLLHLANTLMVYLLVRRLFGSTAAALFTAAFFSIHPLRAESVAWITEQKGLMSSLLMISSLYVYAGGEGEPRPGRYSAALLLHLLAMLCKASAAVLPLLLLARELVLMRRRLSRRLLWRLLPFAILSLGLLLPTLLAHEGVTGYRPLEGLGLPKRAALVARNLLFYPRAVLLPAGLSAVYAVPDDLLSLSTAVTLAALAALVAAALAFRRLRNNRYLAFGTAFYLLTVLPMLQLVPFGRAPMANRFSYLPSVGVLLCVYAGFRLLWRRSRLAAAGLALAALAGSCALTVERLGIWKDSGTLWVDVLLDHPQLSFAYYNLGAHRLAEGDTGRALECYDRAIELDSLVPAYHINRGNLLRRSGRPDMAAGDYAAALSLDPGNATTHFNLGGALMEMGRLEEASMAYGRSVELDPSMAVGWLNLGSCLAQLGERREALACFDRALELDPTLESARTNRLRLLREMGSSAEDGQDFSFR